MKENQTTQTQQFNGRHIERIGGNWWRCTDCGGTIQAECSCCEPPLCNCQSRPKAA